MVGETTKTEDALFNFCRLYLESLLGASESSSSEPSSGICSEDESSAASTRPPSPKNNGKLAGLPSKQSLDEQLRRAVLVAALFQDAEDGQIHPVATQHCVANMVPKQDQEESREM